MRKFAIAPDPRLSFTDIELAHPAGSLSQDASGQLFIAWTAVPNIRLEETRLAQLPPGQHAIFISEFEFSVAVE